MAQVVLVIFPAPTMKNEYKGGLGSWVASLPHEESAQSGGFVIADSSACGSGNSLFGIENAGNSLDIPIPLPQTPLSVPSPHAMAPWGA
jgi:hypothetical protein